MCNIWFSFDLWSACIALDLRRLAESGVRYSTELELEKTLNESRKIRRRRRRKQQNEERKSRGIEAHATGSRSLMLAHTFDSYPTNSILLSWYICWYAAHLVTAKVKGKWRVAHVIYSLFSISHLWCRLQLDGLPPTFQNRYRARSRIYACVCKYERANVSERAGVKKAK